MKMLLLVLGVVILTLTFEPAEGLNKVIFAVNAGGPQHRDIYGVQYQEDKNTEGISSDFGKRKDIHRVSLHDQILYQTERYGLSSFGYDIPIHQQQDGDYVIVLKFCEVYFRSPGQKVFNVVVNREHLVIADLDIFKAVGVATAHDEYIQFKITNEGKRLEIGGAESSISGGKISIKFTRGSADNPKINALYVMKGTIQDVPKLPELVSEPYVAEEDPLVEDGEYEDNLEYDAQDSDGLVWKGNGKGHPSGPRHVDPWQKESGLRKYCPIMGSILFSLVSFLLIFTVPNKKIR